MYTVSLSDSRPGSYPWGGHTRALRRGEDRGMGFDSRQGLTGFD